MSNINMEDINTIKRCIDAIQNNMKSCFEFKGFDTETHNELVNQLMFLLVKKFRNMSQERQEKAAGKHREYLEAFYLYQYGQDTLPSIDEPIEKHVERVENRSKFQYTVWKNMAYNRIMEGR